MNQVPQQEIRRKVSRKTSLLIIVIILFLLAFFSPSTMLLAKLSSDLAKYRAEIKLQSISMPAGMQKIDSFSVGKIDGSSCYAGEAYVFGITNLSASEIESFYHEYFAEQNWSLRSELDSHFYFAATSKQKAYAGRAVEGFTIQLCDDKCLLDYDFLERPITDAQKNNMNVYLLHTWFIPYEVRGNQCWCFSSGA